MQLVVRTSRSPDGDYVAVCPSLPNCVSRGQDAEEALAKHREAVRGYVAAVTDFVPDKVLFSVVTE